jgi:hypothetical protein
VINDKKTGTLWKNVYWFIEAAISEDGLVAMSTEQADISAIFRQRFHWERKQLVSGLENDFQLVVAYHLERFYGFEFFRTESTSHLDDGGYSTIVPKQFGHSRGLFATREQKKPNKRGFAIMQDLYPSEKYSLYTRKEIHQLRKDRWKSRSTLHGDDYDILAKSQSLGTRLGDYQYPAWAESILLDRNLTSGTTIGDATQEEIELALTQYPFSTNPLHHYVTRSNYTPRIQTSADPGKIEIYRKALANDRLERRYAIKELSSTEKLQSTQGAPTIVEVPMLEQLLFTANLVPNQQDEMESLASESDIGSSKDECIDDVFLLEEESDEDSDHGTESEECDSI